jgi:hypothetical protein
MIMNKKKKQQSAHILSFFLFPRFFLPTETPAPICHD